MKFQVQNFCNASIENVGGNIHHRPINWIKAFRIDANCGLKEAKQVCDYLRHNFATHFADTTIEIDSNDHENLKFLEQNEEILKGRTKMITRIDQPGDKVDVSRKVLETAARRLIANGSYKQARKVLKILI